MSTRGVLSCIHVQGMYVQCLQDGATPSHCIIYVHYTVSKRWCSTTSPCTRYVQCTQGGVLSHLYVQCTARKELYYLISMYVQGKSMCSYGQRDFLSYRHSQDMYSVQKEVYYQISMYKVYTVFTRSCTTFSSCTRYTKCTHGVVLPQLTTPYTGYVPSI